MGCLVAFLVVLVAVVAFAIWLGVQLLVLAVVTTLWAVRLTVTVAFGLFALIAAALGRPR